MLSLQNYNDIKYQLNIKICSSDTDIINYYQNFTNHYFGDSGIDLLTLDYINVEPFKIGTLDFKIQCELIDLETNNFSSYYLVPRSSIAKTNFMMANSIGVIDAGYRGNIIAKIRNMNPNEVETVNNSSLFQIIAPDLKPMRINIVKELSLSLRNAANFGSTNK